MSRIVGGLSALVLRAPVVALVVIAAVTAVLGAFAAQAQVVQGNEGFSPDNRELRALERVNERFGDRESVVQVIVEGDDVLTADGVAAAEAVADAVATGPAADRLSERNGRPAIVSYAAGIADAARASGVELDDLPDDVVKDLHREVVASVPATESTMVEGLLSDRTDEATLVAPAGLVLVFLDTADLEGPDAFDELAAVETALAEDIAAADLPAGFSAEPFSFQLLFADQNIDEEVGRLFAMAFGIILVILGFVYWVRWRRGTRWRSLRRLAADVALTLGGILISITWMNGVGVLLGPRYADLIGDLSPPTQIVPILIVGLGVDYAIHLTARYREELGGHGNVPAAVSTAIRTVGVALVLATATTAVGFLTNLVNPLPALRDFGVLAAVGILSSFLVLLTFVPAARHLADRRAMRAGRLPVDALGASSSRLLPEVMARTAVLADRVPALTLAVTLALAGLGAYGLSQLETRFSVTDFVPDDSPLLAAYDTLTEEFGGGFGETTQILLEGDLDRPRAHNAMVASLDGLADTPDVAQVGDRPAAESPISALATLLSTPDRQAGDFGTRAAELGLRPDLTVADDADVPALYEEAREAAPELFAPVLSDGGGQLTARIVVSTTAGEDRADELARALADDLAPLRRAGIDAVPTSDMIVSAVIVQEIQDSQVTSLAVTLAAAMLLLVVTFGVTVRRPMLGVITIAPVGLVLLWTFGLMAATGIPFGPVTATISALAIGIGVPFTIHMTRRFLEDRQRHDDPREAIRSTTRHTGGALAGSAFTTMAGFGVLATSSLTPFRQLGLVTAYAIGFALVAAVLVLPSMLTLWDRWHRRRVPGTPAPAPAPTPAPPEPQPVE